MTVDAAIPDHLTRLSIRREFDAPRALVWKMWTDPAHVAVWWAPEHFTTPVVEMEVRPGGAIHVVMRAPDGSDHPFDGRFISLDEPECLVMRTWVNYADGSTWFEVEQTVLLDEVDGRTILRLEVRAITAGPDALGAFSGMDAGWNGSLDKLEAHVRAVTGG